MSESSKHVLTRREALLLSATAGISMVTGEPAFASDSIKTAAHQEPGNVSTPRSAVAKTQYGKVRGLPAFSSFAGLRARSVDAMDK